MYRAFYGLSSHPFDKDISHDSLFKSSAFKEASARLEYLKNTKGFGLITGHPGAGKTSALRAFASTLNPALFKVMYFPMSSGTVMDFYRALALCLGEQPKFRKVDLFFQIQEAITELSDKRKVLPVFILDEMQSAKAQFLTDLSLLFNFSMDAKSPFVVILAGLPSLADRLRLNANKSLEQRILMRYHFDFLSLEETAAYIQHRLHLSGALRPVFSESAVNAIASASGGCPRLIGNLATHALLLGCQLNLQTITDETILRASSDAGLVF